MVKKLSLYFLLVFLNCADSSDSALKHAKHEAAERKVVSEEWSEEQGRISWPEAMLKCTGIGMRLPTVKEMDQAFKSGETKKMNWKFGLYWTSEEKPKDPDRAFAYYFDFGSADATRKSDVIDVRCRKK